MAKKAFDTSSNPINDFLVPKVVVTPPTKTEGKGTVEIQKEIKEQTPTQSLEETKIETQEPTVNTVNTSSPSVESAMSQGGKPVKSASKKLFGVSQKRAIKAVEEYTPGAVGRKVTKLPAEPFSTNMGRWSVSLAKLIRNERRKRGEVEISMRDVLEEAIEDLAAKYKIKPVAGVYPRPEMEIVVEQ